jgi:hypothetical protein
LDSIIDFILQKYPQNPDAALLENRCERYLAGSLALACNKETKMLAQATVF